MLETGDHFAGQRRHLRIAARQRPQTREPLLRLGNVPIGLGEMLLYETKIGDRTGLLRPNPTPF